MKFFGLFLILVSALSAIFLFSTSPKQPHSVTRKAVRSKDISQKRKSSKLLLSWEKNLKELISSDFIPKNKWSDIAKVRIILLDEDLHSHLQSLKPPIKTKKTGNYILEVSFMSHEADLGKDIKKTGVITQYNLIDINTEEMIWEYSSTFYTDLSKN